MKNILVLTAAAVLLAFASCKKSNNSDLSQVIIQPEVTPADSMSFTINGKLYTANSTGGFEYGNAPVNETVNPITNVVNWIGDPDSVSYYRKYVIYSNSNISASIAVTFVKKYAKANLSQQSGFLYVPVTPLELFTVGQHPYAVDIERERSQNGVAVSVMSAGGSGTSYSNIFLGQPSSIEGTAQNNSTFQVTGVTKLKNGAYILEANFNANLFDAGDHLAARLQNGYVRIHVY